ncbi:MAG: hypothetical protein AAGJ34_08815 [Pseudomonadota bacterium]
MHKEITDQDIKNAIDRAHQFRAEAAAVLGRSIRGGVSKLIHSATHAIAAPFSPSKPQH